MIQGLLVFVRNKLMQHDMVLKSNFPEVWNALCVLKMVYIDWFMLFLLLFVGFLLIVALHNASDGTYELVVSLIELDDHVVKLRQLTSNDLVSLLQDGQLALLKGFRELTDLLLEQIIDFASLVREHRQ